MEKGFLTKTNKFELIETLIKPKIQQKYKLTIESIPNFTKIYDSKARKISKSNPDYTLIEKNMLLIKELMTLFRTVYENKVEEEKIKKNNIDQATINENVVENEIISYTNNMQESVKPDMMLENIETNVIHSNYNNSFKDKQLQEKDTTNMLNELMKQRNMDLNGTNKEISTTKMENNEKNTIELLNDNIIELDKNMTFQIQFDKVKKPDKLYFKKILLFVELMDEDTLDNPYFKVSIDSTSRYFFNNGLNGNYSVYDVCLDLPIDIINKNTLTLELIKSNGEIYKQDKVLIYLNY